MIGLHSKKRRGFNLIEAAIVLGVVGLVVAGIWVAANIISEKREVYNIRSFQLYSLDMLNKYSQGYSLTGTLSARKLMPEDTALPGGFRIHYWSSTITIPISENNKTVSYADYFATHTQSGYNFDKTINLYTYFLQDGTSNPWAYVARPGVCAGLLSWMIGLQTGKHIWIGWTNVGAMSSASEMYWDSWSGNDPPSVNICQNAGMIEVFIF